MVFAFGTLSLNHQSLNLRKACRLLGGISAFDGSAKDLILLILKHSGQVVPNRVINVNSEGVEGNSASNNLPQ